jgi:hypothetical protein
MAWLEALKRAPSTKRETVVPCFVIVRVLLLWHIRHSSEDWQSATEAVRIKMSGKRRAERFMGIPA